MTDTGKITGETVRADFNDPTTVIHYTRAAHFLGLWESERLWIERFLPRKTARLLEAGCGAGRGTLGLWHLGYDNLCAFDIAEELLDQARSLAAERAAGAIRFFLADATRLSESARDAARKAARTETGDGVPDRPRGSTDGEPFEVARGRRFNSAEREPFDGVLFLFNGLMQIPGRENRRAAMRELRRACRDGAPFLFTTHDRDASAAERALWRVESERWMRGEQDPRLVEFGDRYFTDEAGATFMHLPDRTEILEDLAATGWKREADAMRREIAVESRAVCDFSDECRFWLARAG